MNGFNITDEGWQGVNGGALHEGTTFTVKSDACGRDLNVLDIDGQTQTPTGDVSFSCINGKLQSSGIGVTGNNNVDTIECPPDSKF